LKIRIESRRENETQLIRSKAHDNVMVNHTFDTLAILVRKGKHWQLICALNKRVNIRIALALLKTCKLEFHQQTESGITGVLGWREELIFAQANVPKHVVELFERIADIKMPLRIKNYSKTLKKPTVKNIESLLEINALLT
jgi:hypothetical protein